jgi:hypothetical protein
MVRTQTLPFDRYAVATPGQLAWVYLNQLVDYEERLRKIHAHCLPKFKNDYCEVCHEPVIDVLGLPPEIQDKVYRPAPGESYNVELREEDIFGKGEVRVVDEEEIPIEVTE